MFDYAGIDFYTATTNLESVGKIWFDVWNGFKNVRLQQGGKIHDHLKWGFNCVTIGGLTYGANERGGHLMTSHGHVAALTWSKVLPRARRITRVDLQYTFVSPESLDLQAMYDTWVANAAKNRKATIISNSYGGQTLYIGSRQSNQMGRFYNKTAQAKLETPNVYRLEVEVTKPRADPLIESLYQDMNRCSIRASDVRDYVLSWFLDRGIAVDVDFEKVQPFQLSKTITTDEKRLTWLKTGVRPTLLELVDREKTSELSNALGLSSTTYQQMALFAAERELKKLDLLRDFGELKDEMDAGSS